MKRIYENPELEVIVLNANDIVRTSTVAGAGDSDLSATEDEESW